MPSHCLPIIEVMISHADHAELAQDVRDEFKTENRDGSGIDFMLGLERLQAKIEKAATDQLATYIAYERDDVEVGEEEISIAQDYMKTAERVIEPNADTYIMFRIKL